MRNDNITLAMAIQRCALTPRPQCILRVKRNYTEMGHFILAVGQVRALYYLLSPAPRVGSIKR